MDCKNDPDNCFSEKLVKKTIDALVSEGYKDVGYEYAVTLHPMSSTRYFITVLILSGTSW